MSKPKLQGPPIPNAKSAPGKLKELPIQASRNPFHISVAVIVLAIAVAIASTRFVGRMGEFLGSAPSTTKPPFEALELSAEPGQTELVPRVVVFINNHDEALDLFWVDSGPKESKLVTLQPGTKQTFNTFVGHIWVWRIVDTQEFVRTTVVEEETTESQSRFESDFHEQYFQDHGYHWISIYPRKPMVNSIPEPVEIGHKHTFEAGPAHYSEAEAVPSINSLQTFTMETVSIFPKIFLIEDFLSADECDHIKSEALKSGEMKRSGVRMDGAHIVERTSSNTWLPATQSDVIENVFRRGFSTMNVEFSLDSWNDKAESLQVLLYNKTQEYRPHDDFFKPSEYPVYRGVQLGDNRYATLFLYLNDVEEGGETVFPRFGSQYTADACTNPDGFRVKAKKGRAALFFSMLPDGNLDINALHGGCPVLEGTKWGANFWFWDPKVSLAR